MKYVISHPKKYGAHPAIKFSDTNIGQGKGFTTYPLYAIGFMEPDTKSNIVAPIDVTHLKVPDDK